MRRIQTHDAGRRKAVGATIQKKKNRPNRGLNIFSVAAKRIRVSIVRLKPTQ